MPRPRRRRAKGSGSIHKIHDRHGRVRFRAQIEMPQKDGTRSRKYVSRSTRGEVERLKEEMERRIRAGLKLDGDRTPLRDWLLQWLRDFVAPSRRAQSLRAYTNDVELHIAPALGDMPLGRLTKPRLVAFFGGLKAIERTRKDGTPAPVKPLSNAYRVRIFGTLATSLQAAVDEGLILRNPAAGIELPTRQPRDPEVLDFEEAKSFARACADHRLGVACLVGVIVGPRHGEVLGMQWEHLDTQGGVYQIHSQLQYLHGQWDLVPTKTPKSRRRLEIPRVLLRGFEAQRARQAADRLAAGSLWQDQWGLVFTAPDGNPVHQRMTLYALEEILAAAGLARHLRFHDLRHSCLSILGAMGATQAELQKLSGHTDQAMLGKYIHALKSRSRSTAEKMDELFG